MKKVQTLLAAVVVGLSTQTYAADGEGSFVRAHAMDMADRLVSKQQFSQLSSIAHQAAIASVCDGFVLDEAKFSKQFEAVMVGDGEERTDEQKSYVQQHMLVVYGVLVGGSLAEIADDAGAACTAAETSKADTEFVEASVWQ